MILLQSQPCESSICRSLASLFSSTSSLFDILRSIALLLSALSVGIGLLCCWVAVFTFHARGSCRFPTFLSWCHCSIWWSFGASISSWVWSMNLMMITTIMMLFIFMMLICLFSLFSLRWDTGTILVSSFLLLHLLLSFNCSLALSGILGFVHLSLLLVHGLLNLLLGLSLLASLSGTLSTSLGSWGSLLSSSLGNWFSWCLLAIGLSTLLGWSSLSSLSLSLSNLSNCLSLVILLHGGLGLLCFLDGFALLQLLQQLLFEIYGELQLALVLDDVVGLLHFLQSDDELFVVRLWVLRTDVFPDGLSWGALAFGQGQNSVLDHVKVSLCWCHCDSSGCVI